MEANEIEKEYGKFKSAEELLAAYNALEREFTKRCQLIKTLQTAEKPACAQEDIQAEEFSSADDASEATSENFEATADKDKEQSNSECEQIKDASTITQPAPTEESQSAQDVAPTEVVAYCVHNAETIAEPLSDIPQVMDACIAKYKQKLIGMGATVAAVRGAAVITPVRRPKTLQEAKLLADEMLR
ncbi:MAG: hypothetical protein J1G38_03240 [Clostridiales bacterium]|nr:hypothetical protein [Clostridiales bacterium]